MYLGRLSLAMISMRFVKPSCIVGAGIGRGLAIIAAVPIAPFDLCRLGDEHPLIDAITRIAARLWDTNREFFVAIPAS
jgi:hypothetical protein